MAAKQSAVTTPEKRSAADDVADLQKRLRALDDETKAAVTSKSPDAFAKAEKARRFVTALLEDALKAADTEARETRTAELKETAKRIADAAKELSPERLEEARTKFVADVVAAEEVIFQLYTGNIQGELAWNDKRATLIAAAEAAGLPPPSLPIWRGMVLEVQRALHEVQAERIDREAAAFSAAHPNLNANAIALARQQVAIAVSHARAMLEPRRPEMGFVAARVHEAPPPRGD